MSKVHEYRCHLDWSGSTAAGYEAYDRTHRVTCPPARAELGLSSDPAFGGNPELLNPEQLLVVAASSCQMLSFMAYAGRARIDVVSYVDEAEGIMPEDDKPLRITEIVLRPRIVVAGEADEGRVRRFVERAHEACFIANSLKTSITIEPKIEFAEAPAA
jgi:organic hydroperoxide reductase OsmC/OhrA